jgi:hypothetical protein
VGDIRRGANTSAVDEVKKLRAVAVEGLEAAKEVRATMLGRRDAFDEVLILLAQPGDKSHVPQGGGQYLSLNEQLLAVQSFARSRGMWDAADFIQKAIEMNDTGTVEGLRK